MTAKVHLNHCAECGAETSNRSLICDTCAPLYADDFTYGDALFEVIEHHDQTTVWQHGDSIISWTPVTVKRKGDAK